MMHRCDQSAGIYHITLNAMHTPDEFRQTIPGHQPVWINPDTPQAKVIEESPAVSSKTGWEGEMCVHELQWLEDGIPGTTYPKNWEFTWEKVKAATAATAADASTPATP